LNKITGKKAMNITFLFTFDITFLMGEYKLFYNLFIIIYDPLNVLNWKKETPVTTSFVDKFKSFVELREIFFSSIINLYFYLHIK
jgi:hypothetical protein